MYFILIDEKRKIIARYTKEIHNNVPSEAIEVSKEVFDISIQENHNYLNEDLTTYYEEVDERTEEEKKQAKIQEINKKTYQDIILKYPEWKQVNITRMKDYNVETQLEYEEMIAFIDEIRAYADLEVINLDDVLWVYQTSGQLYSTKAK